MYTIYYDRDGNKITPEDMPNYSVHEIVTTNRVTMNGSYRVIWAGHRILQTNVENYNVSTVWLGTNHNFMSDKEEDRLIFETMVFDNNSDSSDELYCKRYKTEEEAARHHLEVLGILREGIKPEDISQHITIPLEEDRKPTLICELVPSEEENNE